MKPKRTVYEIIWEILSYCREPRRLTHIMLACNLSTKTAKRHLDLLISKNMLERRGEWYITTKRGLEYITLFNNLYRKLFEQDGSR